MSIKIEKEKLIQHFKDKQSFTTDELYEFFSQSQPKIKRSTVNWRIYELVQQSILNRIGRGVFSLGKGKNFKWEIQNQQREFTYLIKKSFPLIQFCGWHCSALKEFHHHIAKNEFFIIEVERDAVEAVFLELKETNNNTFKNPSIDIIQNYVYDNKDAIIIKPLLSESPLQLVAGIPFPSIEKVLVDICADRDIFLYLQGNELVNIFKNTFEKYTINRGKLMRYANRRNKNIEIQSLLDQISINNQKKVAIN